MARLLSGKIKKVPSTEADVNRYDFISLENTEPDLGVPSSNGQVLVANTDGARIWTSDLVVDTVTTGSTIQQSNTANTSSTSATTISQWSATTYDSSKAIISAVSNGERQVTELLITHNSSNAHATEYGVVVTGSTLFTVDCSLSSGNVVIQVTAESTTATDYVIHETLFAG